MDKRYQVFVSSTYTDLIDERRNVFQTLMEMDCIPSGMELFPAMDEEQFEFIKKIIDDCDYYVLILGGRYGTIDFDGISYTEKEYEYAVSKGIQVLAFIHDNPENLAVTKSELDSESRVRLDTFRERVCQNRLVKKWNKAEELPGIVALSLQKTIKIYPSIGWVRGDQVPSVELHKALHDIKKENDELRERLKVSGGIDSVIPENLAQGTDELDIEYTFELSLKGSSSKATINDSFTSTWDEVYLAIAPFLLEPQNDQRMHQILDAFCSSQITSEVKKEHGNDASIIGLKISSQAFNQIRIQFWGLGYIGRSTSGWKLTGRGEHQLVKLGAIRR